MPKSPKIKTRARAKKEAQKAAVTEASTLSKAKGAALKILNGGKKGEPIESAPASEHRQHLRNDHALQDAPGTNREGRPINKTGAKGLYTDEVCLTVEKLASEGCTNDQIAAALGIGRKTFYEWVNRYPHFSHALNKYRGVANMLVENALFRSSLGYDYTEEQVAKEGFAVEVRKHVTGSVAAQKFYLTNRMPERYKNKVETVHSMGENIAQFAIAIKRRED